MNQDATPFLDAVEQIRRDGTYTFSLPGHRFGLGIDEWTAAVMSRDVFADDVIMAKSSGSEAEELYADAVGVRQAVFTTCGSSISIHTAMLTVTGPGKKILVDRNVHKSVVASLILSGAEPVWLRPSWDHENEVAHPATAKTVEEALRHHPDVSSVLMITPTEYGTGADVHAVACFVISKEYRCWSTRRGVGTSDSTLTRRPRPCRPVPISRSRVCTRQMAACVRRR